MTLNVESFKIRTTKNELNRFWNPIGCFWNTIEILINDEWYKCGARFRKVDGKYFISFNHPMKVDDKTLRITEVFCDGIYVEVETSTIKFHLIKYLQNDHKINHISHRIRTRIFKRKRTILIFSLALILSILFYIINSYQNNIIIHLIAENTWVQSIFFFLTISGFISIFHPFTIRKELNKEDIKNFTREVLKEEEQNEEARRRAIL